MNLEFNELIEEFNRRNGFKYAIEIAKADGYKMLIAFKKAVEEEEIHIDEHLADFVHFLNSKIGKEFEPVRLFRSHESFYIAVLVSDIDRMKEVVDFGFSPFDLLL